MRRLRISAFAAVITVTMLLPALSNAAAPSNDQFPGKSVGAIPYSDSLSISGSTLEKDEPQPTCRNISRSVWYSFTATTTQHIVASADLEYGPVLAVRTGANIASTTQIGCSYTYDDPASIMIAAQAGTTYYFQIGNGAGSYNSLTFELRVAPPVPNDNFADAVEVDGVPYTTSLESDAEATKEPTETTGDCFGDASATHTTWYKYTPVQPGSMVVDSKGSHASGMVVYTGSSLADLDQKACFFSYYSYKRIDVEAGVTYHFQTVGNEQGVGAIRFNINPPTPGDHMSEAIDVSALPYSMGMDLAGSTIEPGEPYACLGDQSVWFKTTGLSGVVHAHTSGVSNWSYVMTSIYEGGWNNPLDCRYSVWDSGQGVYSPTDNYFEADPAKTYYIRESNYSYLPGRLVLSLEQVPPSVNDSPANASSVAMPSSTTGDNHGATSGVGEPVPSCGRGFGASVWYRFDAPASRPTMVDTYGSDFDTILAVFDSSDMNEIACNDDHNVVQARAVIDAVAGHSYLVQVGGYQKARGKIKLSVDTDPLNDDFADAELATGLTFVDTLSTSRATIESPEPRPSCNSGFETGASVWYRVDSVTGGALVIDTAGSSFDTVLAVYSGPDVRTLTEIACNNNRQVDVSSGQGTDSFLATVLTPGTYWINAAGLKTMYSSGPDTSRGDLVIKISIVP